MKNKITFTFIFTLLVVAGTLALYYLPPVVVDGTPLRKVDLLSDLRPDPVEEEVSDSDSIALPVIVKPAFVDTCKTGMTCIEDYADSLGQGMGTFYEALAHSTSLGRPVRIAYFGDSFIEGDILTADLRTLLQQKFGGRGVGYVPVTSRVAGFRPTVKHTFEGWESHAVTDSSGFKRAFQDISNHYFIPRAGASVTLKGGKNYAACLDTCDVSSFYFFSPDTVVLSAQINGGESKEYIFPGDSTRMQVAQTEGRIGTIRWRVQQAGKHTRCFAVTMDSRNGVILDNFSTRGSSGQQLAGIPMSVLKAYNRLRPYDLIVLQYGLNVASEKVMNYSYYTVEMEKVIVHLKEAFPGTAILIVGIGDRESKTETGELHTMPGVKNLIRYQQALAAKTHVAFWNMFEAMGGEGSMEEMVNSKPAMANYDYTHINFRGGKHLAKILFDALMYGKEQYEKRKAYEN